MKEELSRKWHSTPVVLAGKFQSYYPWDSKESDMIERVRARAHTHTHTHSEIIEWEM